jgi:hypothetical protein
MIVLYTFIWLPGYKFGGILYGTHEVIYLEVVFNVTFFGFHVFFFAVFACSCEVKGQGLDVDNNMTDTPKKMFHLILCH